MVKTVKHSGNPSPRPISQPTNTLRSNPSAHVISTVLRPLRAASCPSVSLLSLDQEVTASAQGLVKSRLLAARPRATGAGAGARMSGGRHGKPRGGQPVGESGSGDCEWQKDLAPGFGSRERPGSPPTPRSHALGLRLRGCGRRPRGQCHVATEDNEQRCLVGGAARRAPDGRRHGGAGHLRLRDTAPEVGEGEGVRRFCPNGGVVRPRRRPGPSA